MKLDMVSRAHGLELESWFSQYILKLWLHLSLCVYSSFIHVLTNLLHKWIVLALHEA